MRFLDIFLNEFLFLRGVVLIDILGNYIMIFVIFCFFGIFIIFKEINVGLFWFVKEIINFWKLFCFCFEWNWSFVVLNFFLIFFDNFMLYFCLLWLLKLFVFLGDNVMKLNDFYWFNLFVIFFGVVYLSIIL